jgi:hypothetical protein
VLSDISRYYLPQQLFAAFLSGQLLCVAHEDSVFTGQASAFWAGHLHSSAHLQVSVGHTHFSAHGHAAHAALTSVAASSLSCAMPKLITAARAMLKTIANTNFFFMIQSP